MRTARRTGGNTKKARGPQHITWQWWGRGRRIYLRATCIGLFEVSPAPTCNHDSDMWSRSRPVSHQFCRAPTLSVAESVAGNAVHLPLPLVVVGWRVGVRASSGFVIVSWAYSRRRLSPMAHLGPSVVVVPLLCGPNLIVAPSWLTLGAGRFDACASAVRGRFRVPSPLVVNA